MCFSVLAHHHPPASLWTGHRQLCICICTQCCPCLLWIRGLCAALNPLTSDLLKFSLLISISSFNRQIFIMCLPWAQLCDVQVMLGIGFIHSLWNPLWVLLGEGSPSETPGNLSLVVLLLFCFLVWHFVVPYFVFIEMVCCLVAQCDFGLVETILHQPPKRWGYRPEPPRLAGCVCSASSRLQGSSCVGSSQTEFLPQPGNQNQLFDCPRNGGGGVMGWWGWYLAGKESSASTSPGRLRRWRWLGVNGR